MNKTLGLSPNLLAYLIDVSVRETPALKKCRQDTAKLESAIMQISPEQGQFLKLIVELMNAKKILELGMFTGYSSLIFASAMASDGRLITCDIDERVVPIARSYWEAAGVAHKIEVKLGKASESLQALINKGEAGTFDIVFIDADKTGYPEYYEQGLTLLRKGGLVIIDNVLWSGEVINDADQSSQTKAIRKTNLRIKNDERVTPCLLPLSDGLFLARKR